MSDEMVAIGTYMARGMKGSEQYAPTKNNEPQLAVDLRIEGGEFDGASMTVTFPFSGKAPEYSIKKLRMMGWQGANLADLTGIDSELVPVRVFDHEYDGKTNRKMEVVYGGGGSFRFSETMDERQKRAFAATFVGLAKSIPGKSSGEAPRQSYARNGNAPQKQNSPDPDWVSDNSLNDPSVPNGGPSGMF